MSLEEGTSFWSSNLMWKVFFCAAVAFPTYTAGKSVLITNNRSEFKYKKTDNQYFFHHLYFIYRYIRIESHQKFLFFWEV